MIVRWGLDRVGADRDAGVGEEHLDRAELGFRAVDQPVERGRVGDVGGECQMPRSELAADRFDCGLEVGGGHPCALGGTAQ